jgi:hypothetical protein
MGFASCEHKCKLIKKKIVVHALQNYHFGNCSTQYPMNQDICDKGLANLISMGKAPTTQRGFTGLKPFERGQEPARPSTNGFLTFH